MNAFRTLDEVIKIAEENPDQQIWCISMDGTVDYLMKAGDIKNTIGNFDWTGVDFGVINNDNNNTDNRENQFEQCERRDEREQEQYETVEPEYHMGKHSYPEYNNRKLVTKVYFFTGSDLEELQKEINEFIADKDIIDIKCNTCTLYDRDNTDVFYNLRDGKVIEGNLLKYIIMIIYKIME